MHITFSSIKVRELCECNAHARSTFGNERANALQRTIADLKAATTLDDLPPLYAVLDEGDRRISIEAEHGFKITAELAKSHPAETYAIKILKLTSNE